MTPRVVLLAAASALTLAACTDQQTAAPRPTPSSDPTGSIHVVCGGCGDDGRDARRTGPADIEGARHGGTVHVLSPRPLGRLDATTTNPAARSILTGLLTRTLTQYAYDPLSRQQELVPDLATDLGTPNADFTLWRFTIRSGVRWQDGEAVTPSQVAAGVARALARSSAPVAPADPVSVDGATLTVRLSAPFPDLPFVGALPAMTPYRHRSPRSPVLSTGPYEVGRGLHGRGLRLVRNPRWVADTDPARTQYPAAYDIRVGTGAPRQGSGATEVSLDPTSGSARDRAQQAGAFRLCTHYWAPDERVLSDPTVRAALALAYPYAAAARAAGRIPDVTEIVSSGDNLEPPGLPGRSVDEPASERPGPVGPHPRRARRQLAAAHAIGTTIRWRSHPHDPSDDAETTVVSAALSDAGFDPRPVASGPVDLRPGLTCADWPTGSALLPRLLAPTGPAHLHDSSLGRLRAEARTGDTPAERAAAWDRLDHRAQQVDHAYVVTGYDAVSLAHGERLEGLAVDDVLGMPVWKSLWVRR